MQSRVRIDEAAQRVQTTLPDGSVIDAVPGTTPEDIARAHALGYANTWEMTRDHDRVHVLLAEAEGRPYSTALWLVAHPGEATDELRAEAAREERAVLLIQRLLQSGLDAVAEGEGIEPSDALTSTA